MPVEHYHQLMFDELDGLPDERLVALENMIRQKERIVRFYNSRVKYKSFKIGISFGRLFCPWIEVVKSLANGLLNGKNRLKLLKYFLEMPMPLLKIIVVMRLIQLMASI